MEDNTFGHNLVMEAMAQYLDDTKPQHWELGNGWDEFDI